MASSGARAGGRKGASGRRRSRAKSLGITASADDFSWLCRRTERINMVAEGDSWFSYPRRYLVFGPHRNILDYVAYSIAGSGRANLLRLAASGDEAVSMLAGPQKFKLANILKKSDDNVQLILFSGGGNDIVGKWDMERLLLPYKAGMRAKDCIAQQRLQRKLSRVTLAYRELLELRDDYAPSAKIVTHNYDINQPADRGAKFLAGLIARGPWIYPYLVAKNIPGRLHLPIVKIFLQQLAVRLRELETDNQARDFHLVDTQGTLRPGHGSDWADEIHPSAHGFARIARLYYARLRSLQPSLPPFKRS